MRVSKGGGCGHVGQVRRSDKTGYEASGVSRLRDQDWRNFFESVAVVSSSLVISARKDFKCRAFGTYFGWVLGESTAYKHVNLLGLGFEGRSSPRGRTVLILPGQEHIKNQM